jgi:hypothetical protein
MVKSLDSPKSAIDAGLIHDPWCRVTNVVSSCGGVQCACSSEMRGKEGKFAARGMAADHSLYNPACCCTTRHTMCSEVPTAWPKPKFSFSATSLTGTRSPAGQCTSRMLLLCTSLSHTPDTMAYRYLPRGAETKTPRRHTYEDAV